MTHLRCSPNLARIFAAFLASVVAATTVFAGTGNLPPRAEHSADTKGRIALHGRARSGKGKATQPPTTCGYNHLGRCLKDVGEDQAGIWSSPLHLSARDAIWLAPLAGATGVAINYDAQAQRELGIDETRENVSDIFSNVALYGSVAGDVGLYFLGLKDHNAHLAETGRLGGEAVVDAALVAEGLKLVTNRQRPYEGNGRGDFWPHGGSSYELDGAFPSGHATVGWALAHVIASEYPSMRVRLAAYGLALAISASRVTAREHFPSDVLVGGAIGYLIGGYVVHHRANRRDESAFVIAPLVDESTHTFGLHVRFAPKAVSFRKLIGWIGH